MARRVEVPWFRKAKDTWYATLDGRSVSLGVKGRANRKVAQEAWHRLMASGPKPAAQPQQSNPAVGEVVAAFLADVEGRAKQKTVEVYRYLLTPFVAKFGRRPAADIRPHDAEAFARKPSWSSSTRNDFLTALVSAFRWAVRAGLLESLRISPFVEPDLPPRVPA